MQGLNTFHAVFENKYVSPYSFVGPLSLGSKCWEECVFPVEDDDDNPIEETYLGCHLY